MTRISPQLDERVQKAVFSKPPDAKPKAIDLAKLGISYQPLEDLKRIV